MHLRKPLVHKRGVDLSGVGPDLFGHWRRDVFVEAPAELAHDGRLEGVGREPPGDPAELGGKEPPGERHGVPQRERRDPVDDPGRELVELAPELDPVLALFDQAVWAEQLLGQHPDAGDVRRQPVRAVVDGVALPAEAAREPARRGLPLDQQDLPLVPVQREPEAGAEPGGAGAEDDDARRPISARHAGPVSSSVGREGRTGGCGRTPKLLCGSDGGLRQQKEAVAVAGGARCGSLPGGPRA